MSTTKFSDHLKQGSVESQGLRGDLIILLVLSALTSFPPCIYYLSILYMRECIKQGVYYVYTHTHVRVDTHIAYIQTCACTHHVHTMSTAQQ